MLRRLYSTLFWGFVVVSSVALFPVAVLTWAVTAPFDPRRRVLHLFTCFWASLYTWLNPAWPVSVEGRDKLCSNTPAVIVANHLSVIDIFVLFRIFSHFKWVSKIENFRIPFIGWNMRLNRYIELKRGDRASILQMMDACEKTLAEGSSVMMFPEGTRSETGEMRPFKPGAFELARRVRCPIQPILLRGTAKALPKKGVLLQGRHPIQIRILDPIPPESFEGLSTEALTRRIEAQMREAMGDWKQLSPSR